MKRRSASMGCVGAAVALMAAGAVRAAEERPQRYLAFDAFSAWRRLLPEMPAAEVCNLTSAGHALWEDGQLRLPDPSLAGDVDGDGREDRAIRLRAGSDEHPCAYVVVLTRTGQEWSRRHVQRIEADEFSGGELVWMPRRRMIGIDSGQTERFTRPATMWSDGANGGGSAGYAVDVKLIYHAIAWNPTAKAFMYERLRAPYKVAEPEVLELLKRDGHL